MGEWQRNSDGVLEAVADGWEARVTSAANSIELTVYHADTKPRQVSGAPPGLLFRPMTLFSRHKTERAARSAAERFISAHAGEPEPELAAPLVAWATVGGRDAGAGGIEGQTRQYVAPTAPGGPFRWWCDCGETEEDLPSPYATYALAYAHGRKHHGHWSGCDRKDSGSG